MLESMLNLVPNLDKIFDLEYFQVCVVFFRGALPPEPPTNLPPPPRSSRNPNPVIYYMIYYYWKRH